jgi:hypothetical protein
MNRDDVRIGQKVFISNQGAEGYVSCIMVPFDSFCLVEYGLPYTVNIILDNNEQTMVSTDEIELVNGV